MPGAGKSTIGKRLARELNKEFIDLDVLITKAAGFHYKNFPTKHAEETFLVLEEKLALELSLQNKIFAPGGSIVYSKKTMEKAQDETVVIYLKIEKEILRKRLEIVEDRAIVGLREHGFDKLFASRAFLYQEYADMTIDVGSQSGKTIAAQILKSLQK